MNVQGIFVRQSLLQQAEAAFKGIRFKLRDFQDFLVKQGLNDAVAYEAAKRHLQQLRRNANASFDKVSDSWKLIEKQSISIVPNKQVQLRKLRTKRLASSLLVLLACGTSIGALILINATFAWEFAQTQFFKVALVAAMMACDLLRPLLVARGIYDMGQGLFRKGLAAIMIALLLAPLSVLSSTTVLSATMLSGAQNNDRAEHQDKARDLLQRRYEQLSKEITQVWRAHEDECNRGGCGPKAKSIAEQAKAAEQEANNILNELLDMSRRDKPSETFVSRTVQSFEALGLFSKDQLIFLPLAIALTLEIAALFGPALLLAPRRRRTF